MCVYVCRVCISTHLCKSDTIVEHYHRRELLNKNTKMCVTLLRVREIEMVATVICWFALPRLEELNHPAMEGS